MARNITRLLSVVLILSVCSAGVAAGGYSGGTGEPNKPYRIATANDLNDIGNHPEDWGSHFVMVNDVNLGEYTGTEFNVIGNGTSWFTGVFDGNGHTISNFTYHCTGSEEYVGIFGYVRAADAEIRDLGLIAPDINGGTESPALWVGSLVGFLSSGSIARCYATGARISGGAFAGGLVGGSQLSGTITDCAFTGTLVEAQEALGGVAASGGGTMSNCYSIASISSSGVVGWGAGGLVGLGGGTFSNCYSNGSVSVSGGSIGGLVGVGFSSVISNCYSTVNLEGCSGSVGGLVGTSDYAYVQVTASFWDLESSGVGTSGGGEGKMTADMQDANTFISAGWDFVGESGNGTDEIWTICSYGGNYPRLWWEDPRGYYVNGAGGSDLNDGLTVQTAFASIQAGIDAALGCETLFVWPGTYTEDVDFLGKAITVAGYDEPAVLTAPDLYAVSFFHGEDANSIFRNFVIKNSYSGFLCLYASPTISNVTVVDCNIGAVADEGAQPRITNSIFWNNTQDDLFQCEALYSCVERGSEGAGSISSDPLFVDACDGDYHLKSAGWRWAAGAVGWTWDEVTSRCIDSGNPGTPLRNERMSIPRDPDNIWGENIRVNMGAYGGTSQASMPPHGWALLADLNNDGIVDWVDVGLYAECWLSTDYEPAGDLNRDGTVNMSDYALLGKDFGK